MFPKRPIPKIIMPTSTLAPLPIQASGVVGPKPASQPPIHVALINWKPRADAQTVMWIGDMLGFRTSGARRAR